ncbi:MAG TPA: hypothetical protein VHF51_16800, partial [Solirubrobacteraceae bacterium]|nr:hypothetical protein [Solirubrobacteraceae bacterium]
MTTLCRAYSSEAEARGAVERLLAAGVPGRDVQVLMGEHPRDAREAPVGAFAPAADGATAAAGAFAGAPVPRAAGMGG